VEEETEDQENSEDEDALEEQRLAKLREARLKEMEVKRIADEARRKEVEAHVVEEQARLKILMHEEALKEEKILQEIGADEVKLKQYREDQAAKAEEKRQNDELTMKILGEKELEKERESKK
jgi:hypothetical protein